MSRGAVRAGATTRFVVMARRLCGDPGLFRLILSEMISPRKVVLPMASRGERRTDTPRTNGGALSSQRDYRHAQQRHDVHAAAKHPVFRLAREISRLIYAEAAGKRRTSGLEAGPTNKNSVSGTWKYVLNLDADVKFGTDGHAVADLGERNLIPEANLYDRAGFHVLRHPYLESMFGRVDDANIPARLRERVQRLQRRPVISGNPQAGPPLDNRSSIARSGAGLNHFAREPRGFRDLGFAYRAFRDVKLQEANLIRG
jgi:hypothetical protein